MLTGEQFTSVGLVRLAGACRPLCLDGRIWLVSIAALVRHTRRAAQRLTPVVLLLLVVISKFPLSLSSHASVGLLHLVRIRLEALIGVGVVVGGSMWAHVVEIGHVALWHMAWVVRHVGRMARIRLTKWAIESVGHAWRVVSYRAMHSGHECAVLDHIIDSSINFCAY